MVFWGDWLRSLLFGHVTASKPHYLNDRRAITTKAKRFVNSVVVFIHSQIPIYSGRLHYARREEREREREEERISLANGSGFPPRHALGSHTWPLRLGAERRWFKWISITENWLARINHNKNGTCGLSSLKDLLPWDTARSLSHHMPQWSTVDGKKCGGFLCRRVFKKRLKIQFISFSFFFFSGTFHHYLRGQSSPSQYI